MPLTDEQRKAIFARKKLEGRTRDDVVLGDFGTLIAIPRPVPKTDPARLLKFQKMKLVSEQELENVRESLLGILQLKRGAIAHIEIDRADTGERRTEFMKELDQFTVDFKGGLFGGDIKNLFKQGFSDISIQPKGNNVRLSFKVPSKFRTTSPLSESRVTHGLRSIER